MTDQMAEQELRAFQMMQELMKRAHTENIALHGQIHNSLLCMERDIAHLTKIIEEVEYDFKRS